MKFSCNNCNTKYSLPDEKFAGKVITLTCKKCGSKIVVKAQKQTPSIKTTKDKSRPTPVEKITPQPQKATGKKVVPKELQISKNLTSEKIVAERERGQSKIDKQQDKPEDIQVEPKKRQRPFSIEEKEKEKVEPSLEISKESETEEEAIWYYSRGGQQKGPFTDAEIKELVDNNVITPKTFIWKDGMMDWMRAGTYKEFNKFFNTELISEKKEKNAIEALGLDKLNKKSQEQENLEADRSSEPSTLSIQDGFFNKEIENNKAEAHQEDVDWSRLPTEEDSETPRENTRIFIMRAGLSESAKKKRLLYRSAIAILLTGIFIFVLIKNLNPILSAVGIKMSSGIDLEMEDLDKDTLASMTPEEREKYKKALLGIKESKKISKEQKNRLAMAIKQKKDSEISDLLLNAKIEGESNIYENLGKDRLQGFSAGGVNLNLESKLANIGINTKIEGVDLSSKVDRQDINLASKMPDRVDRLNEDIIMAVVNRNRGSLKYCYERHLKASSSLEGKAVFKLTIQNTGRVTKVESLSDKIAGSLFEECITKELKKWIFPKFSGEPIIFEVPFVLTTVN